MPSSITCVLLLADERNFITFRLGHPGTRDQGARMLHVPCVCCHQDALFQLADMFKLTSRGIDSDTVYHGHEG